MTDRGISRRRAAVALLFAWVPALPAIVWAQQDPWTSAGVQVLDSSGGGGESKREQADRIQTRYREILSAWVSGEVDRAPDDLIELEKAAVADGDPKSRKRLLQSEQTVIH